jgi:hypothetical protein
LINMRGQLNRNDHQPIWKCDEQPTEYPQYRASGRFGARWAGFWA